MALTKTKILANNDFNILQNDINAFLLANNIFSPKLVDIKFTTCCNPGAGNLSLTGTISTTTTGTNTGTIGANTTTGTANETGPPPPPVNYAINLNNSPNTTTETVNEATAGNLSLTGTISPGAGACEYLALIIYQE